MHIKLALVGLLAAFVWGAWGAENMVGTQSQNEGILAVKAPGKVVVDGDGSDWDFSGEIRCFRDISIRDVYSVKIAAMWDNEALYLFFDWRDPRPMDSRVDPVQDPTRGWVADAEQLRILSGTNMFWLTCWPYLGTTPVVGFEEIDYTKGEWHATTVVRDWMFKGAGITSVGRGIESAYRKAADGRGFSHEMKIPWATLKAQGPAIKKDMLRIGFEFMWGSPQGKGWPAHRFADNMQPGCLSREFFWVKKDVWGDVICVEKGPAEKRRYIPDSSTPEGIIELKVEVPATAKAFTVAIDDEKGRRVRNLVGGDDPELYKPVEKDGKKTLTVRWDALDDAGTLVKAGKYTIRTQFLGEALSGRAEHLWYNPGHPPWAVSTGSSGDWGADHTPFRSVVRAGDYMILGAGFAEGGSATIAVDMQGRKVWGEVKGSGPGLLAADDKYVYFVPNDWSASGKEFLRLDAKTGKFAPFKGKDGKDGSMPILLTDYWGEGATADTFREKYHTTTNAPTELLAEYGLESVPSHGGKFNPNEVRDVSSAAVDALGRLWVVEYTHHPRRVSVWEKPKGIWPFRGKPRLVMDFIGNTQYAASTTQLHDDDPTLVYAEGNEIRLGKGMFDWQVENVMWVPDLAKGDALGSPEEGNYGHGHFFSSDKSGKMREYFVAVPTTGAPLRLYIRDEEGQWRPSSGVFTVAHLQNLYGGLYSVQFVEKPRGAFADRDPGDYLLWADANGDGYVQPEECEVVPVKTPTEYAKKDDPKNKNLAHRGGEPTLPVEGGGWSRLLDPRDFAWFAVGGMGKESPKFCQDLWRVTPTRFLANGAAVWTTNSWQKITLPGWTFDNPTPIYGTDNVVAFGTLRSAGASSSWLFSFNWKTGEVIWQYPNLYHFVHGSHNAPMSRAGLLIGCLKICGVVDKGVGAAPGVFMIRGNLGEDYYLTTDGMYISSFFRDCRLPTEPLPDDPAALATTPIETYSGGGEHFCGTFVRQNDGGIRMSCGIARQSGMSVKIEGLGSIERSASSTITVDDAQLAKAEADNAIRAAKDSAPVEAIVGKAVLGKNGEVANWGKATAAVVERKGLARGIVRLAWDEKNLYARFDIPDATPWKNAANDRHLLFKGGDCVDVQLSATSNCLQNAVAGDVRFVAAPFQGKPVVLEMREKCVGAKSPHTYSSPVATYVFEKADLNEKVKVKLTTNNGNSTALLTIPWTEIGVTPKSGLALRGDIGFILSDAAGKVNAARIYWSNQQTGLVNDIPHEAKLAPSKWGTLLFE